MEICHRTCGDVRVDEEEVNVGKLRSGNTEETDGSDGEENNDVAGGSEATEPSKSEPVVCKCLEMSTASPSPEIKTYILDLSNEHGQETTACNMLVSREPPPLHLQHTDSIPIKSALKGSREELGKKAAKQLCVSWAPDVYDPVSNSLCHNVTSGKKKSRRDNGDKKKKNVKNKGQKGSSSSSSSRGSSGKDKKQTRRKPSKTKSGYKTLDIDEDGYSDSSSGGIELDHVASPDYCGSSFLKKSVTEFQYSVAEAL